jgi:HD-GYP domain-containing protein (c-di-GMP phosphodiesterase class II)
MEARMIFWNKRKIVLHDLVECLVETIEIKDHYTSGHSQRVGDMSYMLAKSMGIRGSKLEQIHIAAHLHDIGKIGVPDSILNKSGSLSEAEFDYIKKHPEKGYDILVHSKALKPLANLVLCHHERWDGRGYPRGISGEDIPVGARIIAVCDSIDAMLSDRPYRKGMSAEKCRKELEMGKGNRYDEKIASQAIKYFFDENRLEKIGYKTTCVDQIKIS